MSINYSRSDYARRPAVDRLLSYLARLFRDEPVGAAVCAGLVLGAVANSGVAIFLGAAAAYVLTEPLRRRPKS